jgi:hypothetical protein
MGSRGKFNSDVKARISRTRFEWKTLNLGDVARVNAECYGIEINESYL